MIYEYTKYYKLYQEYLELEEISNNNTADESITDRLNEIHDILLKEAPHFLIESYME